MYRFFIILPITYMKAFLFLLPALLFLTGCWKTIPLEQEALLPYTGTDTSTVDDNVPVVLPTTWSITVTFDVQPTKLAGNYSGNGAILRAWANDNIKTISVPAMATNIKIGFTFTKVSRYNKIPGNFQLGLDWKNFCNGRLDTTNVEVKGNTYRYSFGNVITQDKPNGVDLTPAVGHDLTIKARVGESNNRLESVTVTYDI